MAGAGRVGRGRLPNISGTQDSRETLSCPVPNCNVRMRADNLKTRHFMTVVKFDIDGNPVSNNSDSFQQLSEEEKIHLLQGCLMLFNDNEGQSKDKNEELTDSLIFITKMLTHIQQTEKNTNICRDPLTLFSRIY